MKLDTVLRAAINEGLLPAEASAPAHDTRPWPVVLLTALGAWLAAVPLLGVISLLFGGMLDNRSGLYLVGILLLAAAVVVLRSREVSMFVEQLAVPALLVGGSTLAYSLFRDLQMQRGAAVMALVAVAVAVLVARPWLRVLLGATAAQFITVAGAPTRGAGPHLMTFWFFAWHVSLALWLAACVVQREVLNDGARARAAMALESLCTGWLLATLAGLAWWSGMTFLVGGSLGGGFAGEMARGLGTRGAAESDAQSLHLASALLALAAAGWAARRWSSLRSPWNAGVMLALVGLSWFMPALGAVLLALAVCISSGRTRLAGAAAVAAAWIVGAFYYQLSWPLATKAAVLIAAAGVLAGLAWLSLRAGGAGSGSIDKQRRVATTAVARTGLALSALAVIAVVNTGIWQKETLIENGQPVFVELAPVDPRSLMQGDFMRLNFLVPEALQTRIGGPLSAQRPQVIARRDARGVATLSRIDDGSSLAADELRIELTPRNGRWTLVSDAWFFKEGEAPRWAPARYGEFRVDERGRALLVGLRGAKLDAL